MIALAWDATVISGVGLIAGIGKGANVLRVVGATGSLILAANDGIQAHNLLTDDIAENDLNGYGHVGMAFLNLLGATADVIGVIQSRAAQVARVKNLASQLDTSAAWSANGRLPGSVGPLKRLSESEYSSLLDTLLKELDQGTEFSRKLADAIRSKKVRVVIKDLGGDAGEYLQGSNAISLSLSNARTALFDVDPRVARTHLEGAAGTLVHEGQHWTDDIYMVTSSKSRLALFREGLLGGRRRGEMRAYSQELLFLWSRNYRVYNHNILIFIKKGGFAHLGDVLMDQYKGFVKKP